MHRVLRILTVITVSTCLFSSTGCREEKIINTRPNPRPVTVLELQTINPVKELQLTGSVKSWKEQDIAFEVSGRLEKIVEMGTQLEGRWEEEGKVHVQGDIMARIDARPYRIRLKARWQKKPAPRQNMSGIKRHGKRMPSLKLISFAPTQNVISSRRNLSRQNMISKNVRFMPPFREKFRRYM